MAPCFLVDGMLGSLARWLRICGYDSIYRRDTEDEILIQESISSGRILLTKDHQLSLNAGKRNVESIQVEGTSDFQMLGFVAQTLELDLKVSESRCPKCNGEINQVQKEMVREKVPENSYNAFEDYWECTDCDSVYWRGGHWDNIVTTITKAREFAGNKTFQQSLYDNQASLI